MDGWKKKQKKKKTRTGTSRKALEDKSTAGTTVSYTVNVGHQNVYYINFTF